MQSKHPKKRIQLKQIPDTNHALVNGSGKADVATHLLQWLAAWFPLTRDELSGAKDGAALCGGEGDRVAVYK